MSGKKISIQKFCIYTYFFLAVAKNIIQRIWKYVQKKKEEELLINKIAGDVGVAH